MISILTSSGSEIFLIGSHIGIDAVRFEESPSTGIATQFHVQHVFLFPFVERHRLYKSDVNTETPMNGCTVQTQKGAIRD